MQHSLVKRIDQWARTKSLPGFFHVPIFDVVRFLLKEIYRYDLFIRANAVAFSFFLSLFPSLIALFTLTPLLKSYFLAHLPQGENFDYLLRSEIQRIMPGVAGERLFNFVDDITSNPRVGLFSVGFIMAIYFASNGMLALMRGFEKNHLAAFRRRNPFKKRYIAILLTLQLGLLLIASVVLIIVGNWFIHLFSAWVHLGWLGEWLLNMVRWLTIIALFYTSMAIIYRFGAATRQKFRFFTPGSALATTLCLLASLGFSFYVNNFNTYNELYGSIGTIMILMLWIQMNTLSILFGFELNASIAINLDLRKRIMEEAEE
ncbi:MAG: YihY/virulence factor BrkB family protein [Lewinellaceae bacterium]|nr:YihY/virulence factor BrkB family protein [Lewinellaceae bacterium]